MKKERVTNIGNSKYQPTKAELEEEIYIPTTPEKLLRAVVQGGAPRRENLKSK